MMNETVMPMWTCHICHKQVSAVWYVEVDDAGRYITAPCTCVLTTDMLRTIRAALIEHYPILTVIPARS